MIHRHQLPGTKGKRLGATARRAGVVGLLLLAIWYGIDARLEARNVRVELNQAQSDREQLLEQLVYLQNQNQSMQAQLNSALTEQTRTNDELAALKAQLERLGIAPEVAPIGSGGSPNPPPASGGDAGSSSTDGSSSPGLSQPPPAPPQGTPGIPAQPPAQPPPGPEPPPEPVPPPQPPPDDGGGLITPEPICVLIFCI